MEFCFLETKIKLVIQPGDFFFPEVSVVRLWTWKRQMLEIKLQFLQVHMIDTERERVLYP